MYKRFVGAVTSSLMIVAMLAAPVSAQNPHFVGQVRVTDLGTTLRVSGSIAGLGNENIDVSVTAQGIASVQCRNPGGNVAPGQDTSVTVVGQQSNLEVKNGRVNFSVVTQQPTATSQACPNQRWTAEVLDVDFTSVTITVFQPAGSGNIVLQQTIQL